MFAVDTNVLLRMFISDDASQHRSARQLLARTAASRSRLFVSVPVLCEMTWVLRARHGLDRKDCAAVLRELVGGDLFLVEHVPAVRRALIRFESGKAGFSDYLIAEIASASGAEAVYTFDKALLRQPGFAKP